VAQAQVYARPQPAIVLAGKATVKVTTAPCLPARDREGTGDLFSTSHGRRLAGTCALDASSAEVATRCWGPILKT